jgi:hypothetical protein
MSIGIAHFNLRVGVEMLRRDLPGTNNIQSDYFRLVGVQKKGNLLEIEDDIGSIDESKLRRNALPTVAAKPRSNG